VTDASFRTLPGTSCARQSRSCDARRTTLHDCASRLGPDSSLTPLATVSGGVLRAATVARRIKAQIKEGRKFEDIVTSKPTADFDGAWAKGFIPGAKLAEMVTKHLMK
jgi:hypothetical protein